jgi:hypothetical protein
MQMDICLSFYKGTLIFYFLFFKSGKQMIETGKYSYLLAGSEFTGSEIIAYVFFREKRTGHGRA